MAEYSSIQTSFTNGISFASKNWLPYSARFSRNLSIFEDPDSVTLNPVPALDSGSVVTDLVKWMEYTYPYDDARYAIGNAGNIYRITSNTWSLDHTIASGSPAGQGLCTLLDALYYANSTSIGRKFALSGSPAATYTDDFFTDGTQNVDVNASESGQTYTVPTSITENATNTLYFGSGNNSARTNAILKLAYDPLKTVQVYVTSKGTGNWTVSLHDKFNNLVGSATVTNGSLTNGAMNSFTFATPIRITIGAIYHIHVTSTVGDGTLQTSTTADLSTAQVKTLFGILIADANFHPMIQHTNGVTGIFVVGNDHYLGVYDGVTYNPNKIALEPGFSVRSLAKINGNIVAFCWKGNDVTKYEYGRAYIWDGIQTYSTDSTELTAGMPHAVKTYKNRLLGVFGTKGNLEISPDQNHPFLLLQSAPKLTRGYRMGVFPGAIGIWQNKAYIGFSQTNDVNAGVYNDPNSGNHAAGDTYSPPIGLEQGIYEFGNQSDRAITYTAVSTEVLNFAYQPSTAIANPSNFSVGCVAPFGEDIYFSYQDGSSYYVDRVNRLNSPAGTGSWESLISDKAFDKFKQYQQMPEKFKRGVKVRVTFVTLPVGCTVTAKWRADRAAAWTFGATAIAGSTNCSALIGGISGLNYKEMEYGFDVTATVNYPVITSCGFFYDPLEGESDAGANL